MKKNLLILLLLVVSNGAVSQTINEKTIVGKWKVVKILKRPNSANFNDLVKSFNSAMFEFKDNSHFNLSTSQNTKLFSMVTDMTNRSKWKLNKNNFAISVGSEADKYSILKIIVAESNGKIIFHLNESELDLEVQKL